MNHILGKAELMTYNGTVYIWLRRLKGFAVSGNVIIWEVLK